MRRASLLLIFLAARTFAADLQYQIPDGWVDLVDPSVDTSRFPANPVHEARSGRYRIYAVDPDNLSEQGANALVNVLEIDQRGPVTHEVMRRAMQEAWDKSRTLGYRMNILDTRVMKLGEVDIGVVDYTLGNAAGTLHLLQYFIPGEKKSAVVTYGCRPDLFDQYRPIFEASAKATKGAYSYGFDWGRALKRTLITSAIGAVIATVFAAIVLRFR